MINTRQAKRNLSACTNMKMILNQLNHIKKKQLKEMNSSHKIHNKNLLLEQNQSSVNENSFVLERDMIFQAKALYQQVQIQNSDSITIPATVSLITKDVRLEQNLGLDLICLIDRSLSMSGEKLQMVKETLKTLINHLTLKDRLSVIMFNHQAEVLFNLKKATQEKKKLMIQKIEKVIASGGTFIASSLSKAMEILQRRKKINQVTSVFLLSDGEDSKTEAKLEQIFENVKFSFTVHTFGYGNDHDAILLTNISEQGKGNFYFVKNLMLLDEFFLDALGSLISVAGQSIEIDIQCQPKSPFDQICISKTYGAMWKENQNKRNYSIQIPFIAVGQRKDFVFELEIKDFKKQFQKQDALVIPIEASLKLYCPKTKKIYSQNCCLTLNLVNQEPNSIQQDIEVKIQYYRVQASEVIEEARLACDKGKYNEAKENLNNMIERIESDSLFSNQSLYVLEDLRQALQAAEEVQYLIFGQTLMIQSTRNNYNQTGMTASFDSNGTQNPSPFTYASLQSRAMVSTLQSCKTVTLDFENELVN